MAKYFEFTQCKSGGSFIINAERGIGPIVWVEASCAEDANSRAEALGIYFNGVEDGRDCPCCGDRWYAAHGDGEDLLSIDETYSFLWHNTVYVHHLNGTVERIRARSKEE
ncbi:MAG: hypothetical protein KGL39_41465 [Patescibacteria group bacterium]|nr:hypothetical protein [Patescibacteria group bacterium]